MSEPDWDAELMKAYGKTAAQLAAEAEAGYSPDRMAPGPRTTAPFGRVSRFEVIDHRMETIAAEQPVRAIVATGAKVTLSFQDHGRTLKVFLSDHEEET
jgi:hypothetical protein